MCNIQVIFTCCKLSQFYYCIIQQLFLLQAAQTSRMDKADILELTVSYLKLAQFEESEAARATKRQYKAGYTSCARVALKFIQESTTVNQIVKINMEEFLTNQSCEPAHTDSSEYNRRLNGLNSAGTCNQVTQEPIHIQIPTASFSKSVPPFSTRTKTVSPNHVVCDVNFWYHRQLNHQQEASPRNFNQS